MAPKRKTEEEYMQQVFCYYCLLRYPDLKALQDHQKSKHLQCQVSHLQSRPPTRCTSHLAQYSTLIRMCSIAGRRWTVSAA